jgi:thiol-disulfide isomerase/thioredoxin
MSVIDVKMFGAGWCAPCQATKPHFFDVADTYALQDDTEISFDYIDVDSAPFEYIKEEGISSIPQIKVYVDGEYEFSVSSRDAKGMVLELDHGIYKAIYQD